MDSNDKCGYHYDLCFVKSIIGDAGGDDLHYGESISVTCYGLNRTLRVTFNNKVWFIIGFPFVVKQGTYTSNVYSAKFQNPHIMSRKLTKVINRGTYYIPTYGWIVFSRDEYVFCFAPVGKRWIGVLRAPRETCELEGYYVEFTETPIVNLNFISTEFKNYVFACKNGILSHANVTSEITTIQCTNVNETEVNINCGELTYATKHDLNQLFQEESSVVGKILIEQISKPRPEYAPKDITISLACCIHQNPCIASNVKEEPEEKKWYFDERFKIMSYYIDGNSYFFIYTDRWVLASAINEPAGKTKLYPIKFEGDKCFMGKMHIIPGISFIPPVFSRIEFSKPPMYFAYFIEPNCYHLFKNGMVGFIDSNYNMIAFKFNENSKKYQLASHGYSTAVNHVICDGSTYVITPFTTNHSFRAFLICCKILRIKWPRMIPLHIFFKFINK